MASDRLTPSIRTLFADLLQQVETAPPVGTPYERRIEGGDYLYAKVPVGVGRIDVFLGRADDPAVRSRAEEMRQGMALAKSRRSIVSMLKRAGLTGPDQRAGAILDALSQAKLFDGGAVLIGTAAYMLSEALVGRRLPVPTLMTGDLDLATARLAVTAEPPQSMQEILRRADPTFEGLFQLDPRKPPSRFRNAEGFLVELLTPIRSRYDTNPMPLDALSAGAIPLQYLGWLIADPVRTVALWGAGVMVNVPQPARYAVHKLIVAQRRNPANRIKRTKDLAQAGALITALRQDDPFALEDAMDDARARGKAGWADLIDRSLAELAL
jgi:hypothetical protein